MEISEFLLGQIPEAIYFALFLIFTKQLKTKRLLFVVIMILEYILVMNVRAFSTFAHVIYTGLVFITLKVLYKDASQLTDIFTFGIASLLLIGLSLISAVILKYNFEVGVISSRVLPFIALFTLRDELSNIQKLYKKLWNRNFMTETKMKSTTFRCVNVVIFNLMFYIINAGMIYAVLMRK